VTGSGGGVATGRAAEPSAGRPRGLLAVFAHPDDESFGVAGVMALAAGAGIPVHLVCATDGDLGGREGAREMPRDVRREELRRAMAAIGVGEPTFLGYRDSGMENWPRPAECFATANPEEVVARLVAIVRQVRPATVLTFDPGGIYGHPDHVAISASASEAYRRTTGEAGGPTALYHVALPRSAIEEMGRLREVGAGSGAPPPPTEDDLLQQRRMRELARPDDAFTTRVDVRSVLDRKLAALAAHESQVRDSPWGQAPRELLEGWLGYERFVRVDPPPAPGEHEEQLAGAS
jgi:LmbE family N-acetylglucosaminyl deacetylase